MTANAAGYPSPLPLPAISASRYPIDRYTLRNRIASGGQRAGPM